MATLLPEDSFKKNSLALSKLLAAKAAVIQASGVKYTSMIGLLSMAPAYTEGKPAKELINSFIERLSSIETANPGAVNAYKTKDLNFIIQNERVIITNALGLGILPEILELRDRDGNKFLKNTDQANIWRGINGLVKASIRYVDQHPEEHRVGLLNAWVEE